MAFTTIDFSNPERIIAYESPDKICLSIQSSARIYQLYEKILRRVLILQQDSNEKAAYEAYLGALRRLDHLKVCAIRPDAPAIPLNLQPMIRLMESRQQTFKIDIKKLDSSDMPKIKAICEQAEKLTTMGLGFSFSRWALKKIFQLPQTDVLIARDNLDQKIVGYLSSTELHFPQADGANVVKILFVSEMVKDPAYPGIKLIELMQAEADKVIAERQPDYVALCVDDKKKNLIQKYLELNFELVEEFVDKHGDKAAYMVKRVQANALPPPQKFTEIPQAIFALTKKEWGKLKFVALGVENMFKGIIDGALKPFFNRNF